MRTVAIFQQQIPHYRSDFFSEVCIQGKEAGLNIVVYSAEPPDAGANGKFHYRVFPVGHPGKKNRLFWLAGLTDAMKEADIIVAPQELRCLNILYLWVRRRKFCKRWIWWGHGRNMQRGIQSRWSTRVKEAAKEYMTRRGEGLITYTAGGARYWREKGMPADRVIPFFNTLNVEGLRKTSDAIPPEQLENVKRALDLNQKYLLLFSGRLYREKKADFLLRAFALLQKDRLNAALLILGDGPERSRLEALASQLNLRHVHFLGEQVEPKKAGFYFRLADLLVIPGLVGLAIVHGFAFGLPLVTTEYDGHGPEIEYLTDQNGVITAPNEAAYADVIKKLLSVPAHLLQMQKAAWEEGDRLLLGDSARRFVEAIRLFPARS